MEEPAAAPATAAPLEQIKSETMDASTAKPCMAPIGSQSAGEPDHQAEQVRARREALPWPGL
jgi:hypothetical protein